MYSVQCTVYSVQCTVYSVHCTVCSVQCKVQTELVEVWQGLASCNIQSQSSSTAITRYTLRCTGDTLHLTLNSVQCTLYSVHCTLHSVHCTLHSVHCTLHSVHCTLHTVDYAVCSVQHNSIHRSDPGVERGFRRLALLATGKLTNFWISFQSNTKSIIWMCTDYLCSGKKAILKDSKGFSFIIDLVVVIFHVK